MGDLPSGQLQFRERRRLSRFSRARLGKVGIDRDYNSLRQDLWLATDQAYKEAVTGMSLKNAFLRSLTKPPEIDDFSTGKPAGADRAARGGRLDQPQLGCRSPRGIVGDARVFRKLTDSRVTYYLVYRRIIC